MPENETRMGRLEQDGSAALNHLILRSGPNTIPTRPRPTQSDVPRQESNLEVPYADIQRSMTANVRNRT